MTLLERPPYTPFMDPRMARPPGLMPLEPAGWFVIHPDFAGQMAYRERLLAERRDTVLALSPEGRDAAGEMLAAVAENVAGLPGYRRDGACITRPDGGRVTLDEGDPLDTAGRLVADDLCLLLSDPEQGEYRLAGAVLCFPSRWLLAEKMGRPMAAIHDPVPHYAETLARRVNRVFEGIRAGRPLWRVNWIVHASPELHLPVGHAEKIVEPDGPDGGLYLRTERQTLTRLPRSGAVVFGIKTSVSPLEALTAAEAAELRDAVAAYDAATIAYKSGEGVQRAVLDRLAEIACQGAGESAS